MPTNLVVLNITQVRPWGVAADLAMPCATQNEILEDDAKTMLSNGIMAVSEGANMPTEIEGIHHFLAAKIFLLQQSSKRWRCWHVRFRNESEF